MHENEREVKIIYLCV